jgi:TetR/AcrR family transcriptional regulator, lmrAB and yxaGH operons repressor
MGVTTDTRARMITSAALLLREHGVAGTSIPKVLAHSSGPRGSVGHHFPGGRTELITEALTWAGNLVTDALGKKREAGASSAELFAFICDFYVAQLTSTDFVAGCPVGAAAQEAFDDPIIGPVVADIVNSWATAVAESLVAEGRSRSEAADLALLCVSSLEGAILIARVQKSARPIELVSTQMQRLLGKR